jgi:hypothetical protein
MKLQTRPRPRGHLGTCLVSGKVRFRDHREAVRALHSAARAREFSCGESHRAECRAYACPACRGWHLTSKAA